MIMYYANKQIKSRHKERKENKMSNTNTRNHLTTNDLKANYYALFLAIVTHKTISQSLMAMGLSEGKVTK